MNHPELLIALLAGTALLALKSAALPLCVRLSKSITSLLTLGLDTQVRADRLAELEAYIYDLTDDLRKQGYRPSEMAFHLLLRTLLGLGDDLGWRISLSPPLAAKIALACATTGTACLIVGSVLEEFEKVVFLMSRGPVVVAFIAGVTLTWAAGALILTRALVQLHILLYGAKSAR